VTLCVVSDRDGDNQVLQIMTRDLLSLGYRLWWVFPLCPMNLYVVLNCDGDNQVLQIMTRDLLSLGSRP
jgi:hypothetical protein